MIRESAVKKILYWCPKCNVPLIAKSCSCGSEPISIQLQKPFELRPVLSADHKLIKDLLFEKYGPVPIPKIILLNKYGGDDRAELIILNGVKFGWLLFDPVERKHRLDIAAEGISFIIGYADKGIIDIDADTDYTKDQGRIGGKRVSLKTHYENGTYIVKFRKKYGTGIVKDGTIKVKELLAVEPALPLLNPDWKDAIVRNKNHLKNLEHNAVRVIKKHMSDRPTANVSFSGGKDSTAILHLAKKAGVKDAFFIDTGLEFPQTIEFAKSEGVEVIEKGGDFWQAVERAGPPAKDNRWCCKLLKLNPLKVYLSGVGPSVTIQGNRWYESWNRADLEETSQNPANPLQLNVSPIRSWRAFEVFLYLWWQNKKINPLYDMGLERIGCYLCPAMLESEYETMRLIHPDYTDRWDEFLEFWSDKKGYPPEYKDWGLWRWKALPPKMREICKEKGVAVNYDYTLKTGPVRVAKPVTEKTVAEKIAAEKKTAEETTAEKTTAGISVKTDAPGASGSRAEIQSKVPEKAVEDSNSFYDVSSIRKDFSILGDVTYLDNAATGFSPEKVIDAMCDFERNYRSNVGRGVHSLTRIASQKYWHAHEKVAKFIGGEDGVLVFTKNTTEAVNMVAMGMSWKPGDRVITTILEHHSNLLPWRALSRFGVVVDVIGIDSSYMLNLSELEEKITPQTRIVAVTHASNALGVVTPVEKISAICKKHGLKLLVDGAQSVPHIPVNVADIGCDYFAFSGHKMLGPMGTGVLWMKEADLEPLFLGGGMVESVTADGFTPETGYRKYEAGTPNVSGGIGLGAAVDYLTNIGMENIRKYEESLTERLIKGLLEIPGVWVYANENPKDRIGVVSFTIDGISPHEAAQMLDENSDIMLRSGKHCCHPLMDFLGLKEGTVRASIALYNTAHEIDLLIASVKEIAG